MRCDYKMRKRTRLGMVGQFIVVVFLALGIGCDSSLDSDLHQQAGQTVIFDSGIGTGQYDRMTYLEYKSEIQLTPQIDLKISGIRPRIWYCNGSSGFLAFIRGIHYDVIASEAGLVDGDGDMVPSFSDRHFDSDVTLKAGVTYIVSIFVWTTKSVGIFTTGSRTEGLNAIGTYTVNYSQSGTVDHLDRGGIAFQLLK